MVKPDLDPWTRTDPIFRVMNQFFILCLIGSRVGSGRGVKRVGLVGPTRPEPKNFIRTRTRKSCHTYEPEHNPNISGLTRTRPVQPEFSNF
ncbi:hypothetical protein Hanom_Chr08g00725591 [Helianthus anomalus]